MIEVVAIDRGAAAHKGLILAILVLQRALGSSRLTLLLLLHDNFFFFSWYVVEALFGTCFDFVNQLAQLMLALSQLLAAWLGRVEHFVEACVFVTRDNILIKFNDKL